MKKIPHLILGGIFVFSFSNASAQFKKFESKTRFNKKGNKASPKNFIDDSNNKKAFGNRTQKLAPIKGNKFVNLNPETAFGPDIITSFDFPNTDIMELTRHMQKLTGINLILDKDVKGKVSITAPTPITVGDAWKAYLAALNMANYTMVKSGAFYKIINARDVRYVPTKIYTGVYTPETEAHIMKVMALKNVNVSEITRNFRPFMSRYGRIIDIKQTNTIIISDTGANIARLEKLIKFIDVPGHEDSLQIIKVKNSSAQEIAKLLDQILKTKSTSSRSTRSSTKRFSSSSSQSKNISNIISEPRTNSIIAMANATGAKELRRLINKLDVKLVSSSAEKIHVHYLNYGNAEELAKTLSTLVSGSKSKKRVTGSRSFITKSTAGSSLFSDDVKITADKNNNALVVTASPTDWLTIQSVISKLDIPRDQVYVEGLIMETSAVKVRSFGVEYAGAYGQGAVQRAGFGPGSTASGINSLLAGGPTSLSGFFTGVGGGGSRTVSIGGQDIKVNSVNALIRAVASNDNTNVLATPQILALDNVEAEFEVGETIPIKKETTTGSSVQTSVDNQEAKLSLKITPQINKVSRFVKLKINQSINDFVGELNTNGAGARTTTRSAITEIIVRDKDTIAMGGLLRDRETVSQNKIPLLGDIPVLGWLFKSKSRQIEKVNLLFFLTPKIISPYDKLAAENSINALERRTKSMKQIVDEESPDPHKEKVDELMSKLKRQKDGPLYDSGPNEYQKTNNSGGIAPNELDAPDYDNILKGE